jgi:hypothetical protein
MTHSTNHFVLLCTYPGMYLVRKGGRAGDDPMPTVQYSTVHTVQYLHLLHADAQNFVL